MEPRSTAGFIGGKVRFSCHATADPDVTQYDWYVALSTVLGLKNHRTDFIKCGLDVRNNENSDRRCILLYV